MLFLFSVAIYSVLKSCHTVVVVSVHSFPISHLPEDSSVKSGMTSSHTFCRRVRTRAELCLFEHFKSTNKKRKYPLIHVDMNS